MDASVLLTPPIPGSFPRALMPSSREELLGDAKRTASRAARQSNLSSDLRLSLLRQHGTFTNGYSVAFQEGLEYFGDDQGFLAFKMVGGTALVLADPLTSPENREGLIRRFLQEKRDVSFCQVSPPVAALLARMGFMVNEMGTETWIDLAGYKMRNLRRALRRMTEAGYVIKECTSASVGIDKLAVVSERWRGTRTYKSREVCFLNRPIVLDDEIDVRKFFAFDRDGNVVGFSFFDPVYQDGQVTSYVAAFKRRLPEVDPLMCSAIMQVAIERFQQEKRKSLYFGLSPLAEIEDKHFRHSVFMSLNFQHAFRCPLFNRFVYPLIGHATHKYRYGSTAEQTFFAFNTGWALPRMYRLLKACNMI
jgi:phosphatidylglycerol lysyltransferase